MSTMPETEQLHQDIVAFLIQGSKTLHDTVGEDGLPRLESIINSKKIWYQTHLINSDMFGRLAYLIEEFANMAIDTYNHMCYEMASVLSNQIMQKIQSYYFSIDAKSSESVRDKHNTQGTLLHVLTKNKVEKHYNITGNAKRTFMDGMMGRDARDETAD